ncbi:MAG: hypothetical protein ACYC6R_15815 [Anaerolineales bacterium]
MQMGHVADKVIGLNGVKSISIVAEKITGAKLPKWNHSIPHSARLPSPTERGLGGEDKIDFIYFPSCISRQLGMPKSGSHLEGDPHLSLVETLIAIAQRADINLHIPENVAGHCCGMPFASKGYKQAYRATLQKMLMQMWE